MFVLSQGGSYGFNLDNYSFSEGYNADRSEFYIAMIPDCYKGNSITVATYSTEEKAHQALNSMLNEYKRNQFMSRAVMGCLDTKAKSEDETDSKHSEDLQCFFDQVRESFVFQFPADTD